ncbi:TRAP transporter small permease [Ammoniphilus sp. CFH 90114]|uniref:TRAP transporter small permease n=1 Tax=Ammoniphilus sp. CFH 90114 TaxID=2493665 RepID=UPI0013E988CC|nr:TRAP transporter small permease [Ammoniphilus sp. CFH 90114]
MKSLLVWLDRNFEPIVMSVLFYAMMILITVQVLLRFGFNTGFSWAEEVARFIFVWLMYFSISYVTRTQGHIKVSLVIGKLNEKTQKAIMILSDFLFIGFSVVIFLSAIKICQSALEFNDRAVSLNVSMNILYGAGVVGFLLILMRLVQSIVWKLKHFSKPMEYFENGGEVYSGAVDHCLVPKGEASEKVNGLISNTNIKSTEPAERPN